MIETEHDPRELQVSFSYEAGAQRKPAAKGPGRGLTGIGVLLLAASVIAVPQLTGGSPTHGPTAGSSAAAGVRPAQEFRPRLIAPDAASAGERIPVLAFRHRRTCGQIELTFDDAAVVHRPIRYAGSPEPGWMEIFMTLTVPSGTAGGRHEIQLYGPTGPCPKSPNTAGRAKTRELLATSSLTIAS